MEKYREEFVIPPMEDEPYRIEKLVADIDGPVARLEFQCADDVSAHAVLQEVLKAEDSAISMKQDGNNVHIRVDQAEKSRLQEAFARGEAWTPETIPTTAIQVLTNADALLSKVFEYARTPDDDEPRTEIETLLLPLREKLEEHRVEHLTEWQKETTAVNNALQEAKQETGVKNWSTHVKTDKGKNGGGGRGGLN